MELIKQILETKGNNTLPEALLAMDNADLMKASATILEEASLIQQELLKEIISFGQETEFGHKHDFAHIKNIDDFRKQVPITSWHDFESYVDRMADGESDLLFPGKAQFFTITSGSTGKEKLIPESKMSEVVRKLILRYRTAQYLKLVPNLMEGRLLPLINALVLSKTNSGIPCGAASGLTVDQSNISHLLAFPLALLQNQDSESTDYLIMRLSIAYENVHMIIGNNAGRLSNLVRLAEQHADRIIKDIEDGTIEGARQVDPKIRELLSNMLQPNKTRAAQLRKILEEGEPFIPKYYWPDLKLASFWLSSSVGTYVEEVKPLLPSTIKYMDSGYGSSEAKFNIPTEPDRKDGTLSIATSFYEFIPEAGGDPLLAHEVEVGKTYRLVITTWGGLYRYDMKDIIQVNGFSGSTPIIEFIRKECDQLNICGEKVPVLSVDRSIREVLSEKGLRVKQIQVYPNIDKHRYDCYIELIDNHLDCLDEHDRAEIDRRLINYSLTFQIFNAQGLINSPHLIEMRPGWQESLYLEKLKPGLTISQIKLPILIHQPANSNWILS